VSCPGQFLFVIAITSISYILPGNQAITMIIVIKSIYYTEIHRGDTESHGVF
jgi:hypothetical protein